MDRKDLVGDSAQDLLADLKDSHSQPQKDAGLAALRRDNDSLDDFEHLEHDVSPVKEPVSSMAETAKVDNAAGSSEALPTRGVSQVINTTADSLAETATKVADGLRSDYNQAASATRQLVDSTVPTVMSTVSDLLDMDDAAAAAAFAKPEKTTPTATTDLLGDFAYAPPVPPHADPPATKPAHESATRVFGDFDNFKTATQSFMDLERDEFLAQSTAKAASAVNDLADRFSDSEPEVDDFKQSSNEDFKFAKPQDDKPGDFLSKTPELSKPDTFKDVIDEPEPEPEVPQRDYFDKEPLQVKESPSVQPEPVKGSEAVKTAPEPISITMTAPVETVTRDEPPQPPLVKKVICILPVDKTEVIAAEAMFCKMGLVESLIYWRDPRKSGAVFGGTLVVLLSLAYFSLISVAAYLSLLALAGTISFRIYKNVLQAVQKTADGHPFKEFLEADVALPQDKVRELTDIAVAHVNAAVVELRRLFLVEDLVDSIKFGVLLWCLTYVGAWFNGMTIIIIAFVALFTLPKVYENNKTQIDANLDIVRTKLAEFTSKVKAAIPIGKKIEEKKEQ